MNSCIMVLLSLFVSLSYNSQVGTELFPRLAHVDHKKSGQVIRKSGTWWSGGQEGAEDFCWHSKKEVNKLAQVLT